VLNDQQLVGEQNFQVVELLKVVMGIDGDMNSNEHFD
jgi:hypothetical protein